MSGLRSAAARKQAAEQLEKLKEELIGKRFGRLIVIEYAGTKGRNRLWRCKCDCGNEKLAIACSLRNGSLKSCGCLNSPKEKAKRALEQHRMEAGKPLYCRKCGKQIQNPSGATNRRLCDDCKPKYTGYHRSTQMAGKSKPKRSLSEINALARASHMSYGQYQAMHSGEPT